MTELSCPDITLITRLPICQPDSFRLSQIAKIEDQQICLRTQYGNTLSIVTTMGWVGDNKACANIYTVFNFIKNNDRTRLQ